MTGKYNGMKRAGDWKGQRVITLRRCCNGWGEVPAGTRGHVSHVGRNGIHFHSDPCESCGIVMKISALNYDDVKLEDPKGYTMPTVRVREMADARIQEENSRRSS